MNLPPIEAIEARLSHIKRLSGRVHAQFLLSLTQQTKRDAAYLEIGTYYGYLSAVMAIACEWNARSVTVVDPFMGGMSDIAPGSKCHYLETVDNWKRAMVWERITPFTTTSRIAIDMFKLLNPRFDLVFLDGDHNYDPVLMELTELEQFEPVGAYVTGDDCNCTSAMNFTDSWNANDDGLFDGLCVSKAVIKFFRNNPRFEVLQNVPRGLFGFQKIA